MNTLEKAIHELSQEIQQGLEAAQNAHPEVTAEQYMKTLATEIVGCLEEIDSDKKQTGATWQELGVKCLASIDALQHLSKHI